MKIKVHKSVAASTKTAPKSTSTKAAKKNVELHEDKRSQEPKKYTVATVLDRFHTEGVDGSPIFMKDKLDQVAAHRLWNMRDDIAGHKTAAVHGKFLCCLTHMLYCWELTGLSGDIYERRHSKNLKVRGSIDFLKKCFGPKNVMLVTREQAIALTKKYRTEKESKQTLAV